MRKAAIIYRFLRRRRSSLYGYAVVVATILVLGYFTIASVVHERAINFDQAGLKQALQNSPLAELNLSIQIPGRIKLDDGILPGLTRPRLVIDLIVVRWHSVSSASHIRLSQVEVEFALIPFLFGDLQAAKILVPRGEIKADLLDLAQLALVIAPNFKELLLANGGLAQALAAEEYLDRLIIDETDLIVARQDYQQTASKSLSWIATLASLDLELYNFRIDLINDEYPLPSIIVSQLVSSEQSGGSNVVGQPAALTRAESDQENSLLEQLTNWINPDKLATRFWQAVVIMNEQHFMLDVVSPSLGSWLTTQQNPLEVKITGAGQQITLSGNIDNQIEAASQQFTLSANLADATLPMALLSSRLAEPYSQLLANLEQVELTAEIVISGTELSIPLFRIRSGLTAGGEIEAEGNIEDLLVRRSFNTALRVEVESQQAFFSWLFGKKNLPFAWADAPGNLTISLHGARGADLEVTVNSWQSALAEMQGRLLIPAITDNEIMATVKLTASRIDLGQRLDLVSSLTGATSPAATTASRGDSAAVLTSILASWQLNRPLTIALELRTNAVRVAYEEAQLDLHNVNLFVNWQRGKLSRIHAVAEHQGGALTANWEQQPDQRQQEFVSPFNVAGEQFPIDQLSAVLGLPAVVTGSADFQAEIQLADSGDHQINLLLSLLPGTENGILDLDVIAAHPQVIPDQAVTSLARLSPIDCLQATISARDKDVVFIRSLRLQSRDAEWLLQGLITQPQSSLAGVVWQRSLDSDAYADFTGFSGNWEKAENPILVKPLDEIRQLWRDNNYPDTPPTVALCH